jgi:glycosyltransferase involved in cell wall biosynthesis
VIRVGIVDPSAFTLPYDHALSAALARAGAEVELLTSRFAYGQAPTPSGYELKQLFYRHAVGGAGSASRRAAKLAEHVPDMLRLRSRAVIRYDVVHFQWLALQWLDGRLLPRPPVVLTAHDLLPREARAGQAAAQRRLYERVGAVIVHSQYGRGQLVERLGVPADKVHVVPHGAFTHLAELPAAELPAELGSRDDGRPVALFFGLLRPYKGVETLLGAWRGITGAELWVVGRPRMEIGPLRAAADGLEGVTLVPRFVPDAELPALFRRADVVVLPYARTERFDFSGVLATALAFGKAVIVSDIGGFGEVAAAGAARLVAPEDVAALHGVLEELLGDAAARERLGAAALRAAHGPYSWDAAARATLEVYRAAGAEPRP